MFVWKEIDISDLERNTNELDLSRMFKSGAVIAGSKYHALEIERNGKYVTVLAQLERGFEEYVEFRKKDYEKMPSVRMEMA